MMMWGFMSSDVGLTYQGQTVMFLQLLFFLFYTQGFDISNWYIFIFIFGVHFVCLLFVLRHLPALCVYSTKSRQCYFRFWFWFFWSVNGRILCRFFFLPCVKSVLYIAIFICLRIFTLAQIAQHVFRDFLTIFEVLCLWKTVTF